ncbi:MAG: response regulator [Sphingobacteriaceae bacterium]|nr:response regulator [Sphingobacteriaceae bacterium]
MKKRRILVIEDDDIVRDTIELLLSYKGFKVSTSATGLDILPKIEEFKPDLIITDIFLGQSDGRVICQSVKNDPKTHHIPVIIMSGAATDIYNTIIGAGANDIVLKPFDEQTLLSRVQRQLSA